MPSFDKPMVRIVVAGILGCGLVVVADLNGPASTTTVGGTAVEMAAVSTPQPSGTGATPSAGQWQTGQGAAAGQSQGAGGQSQGAAGQHHWRHRHHRHWWSFLSGSDSSGSAAGTATSTPSTAAPLSANYAPQSGSQQQSTSAASTSQQRSSSGGGYGGGSAQGYSQDGAQGYSQGGSGSSSSGGSGTARGLSLRAPSSASDDGGGGSGDGSAQGSGAGSVDGSGSAMSGGSSQDSNGGSANGGSTTTDSTSSDDGTGASDAASSDTGSSDATASDTTASDSPSDSAGATDDSAATGLTADSVISASGVVNAAGYKTMAGELGSAAGVAYRFGPAATGSTSGRSTAYEPTTKSFTSNTSKGRVFEVGTQDPSKQDFSNDQGQVGYVPTGGTGIGVDHVQTVNMDQNTIDEKPGLSWTYFGGGHPEPDFTQNQYSAGCVAKLGASVGHFVAQARAYAHGEYTANSLVAFDNGVIAAAGTNTARGHACLKLPANLHPSAISVTNGNEFALVTVWNTDTLKSELAVIALGGQQPAGAFWHNEWTELYPGMSNYGTPTFMKLLGTVPLGIAAATAVSAVSDDPMGQWLHTAGGQNVLRGDFTLSNEGNRQTFITGPNKDSYPKSGYAVVTSRSEKKVVFVDLQPLFAKITGAYFGDRSAFTAAVGSVGQGATQFPATFASSSAEKPVVVKTVSLAQAPTSVAAMLDGAKTPRAYVGTVDGKLHVFDVGGLASTAAASASAITDAGSITVGKNPTGITYLKDRSTGAGGQQAVAGTLDDTLIVTSRADREVQWVSLTGDSGTVVRTLADSRLVDPIAAEDNNNHGTESYILSIADYGAGKLFNYRYGPAIFHTQGGSSYGMGASGNDKFEFGGAYTPGGKPFSISVTNVT